jgi:hypothetical protein
MACARESRRGGRQKPEAGLTQPRMTFDLLIFESLARVKPPLVEHLRSEFTKLRVQVPGLFQEQAFKREHWGRILRFQ